MEIQVEEVGTFNARKAAKAFLELLEDEKVRKEQERRKQEKQKNKYKEVD
ncbi:hypothetical protein [Bacillus mycoides]|nr:hypothetical protein [Bacillus mycoides]